MSELESIPALTLIKWERNAEKDLADPNWHDPHNEHGRGFRKMQLDARREELRRRGVRAKEELWKVDDACLQLGHSAKTRNA